MTTGASPRRSQAAAAGLLAAGALFALAALAARSRRQARRLVKELEHERGKRAADRTGRIRAERQLKEALLELTAVKAATGGGDGGGCAAATFPLASIGTVRSPFASRNGTPRQPHLAPAARAVVQLHAGVPPACLDGLEQYSHVWLIYIFHANTDLAKLLAARAGGGAGGAPGVGGGGGVKSHIHVPRLDGAKMGVLATRSPHRPVPIGLSTAEVLHVDAAAGRLVLGGADVVDGSPVLDIKPYVPFCDSLPRASAPAWVAAEADDEPLALGGVVMSGGAASALAAAWEHTRRRSLYSSAEGFAELVEQVLSRDIRSLHQRTSAQQLQHDRHRQPAGERGAAWSGAAAPAAAGGGPCPRHWGDRGQYQVVLDGVCVQYDVDGPTGQVHVRGASVAAA